MFYIVTGKPGAGKSYRITADIFYELNKKYVIFHNLDGLKPDLFPFPDRLKSIPDLYPSEFADRSFFHEDFQKNLVHAVADKYQVFDKNGKNHPLPVCIIVDEAHRIFDEKNKAGLAWLSYHRHLGQLVIFCTQKDTMLHHSYRALMAFEIRAKADVGFAFLYQKLENGENTGFTLRLKKQSIFDKYLSYELTPPKHRNLIYLFICVFALLCSVYFFINPFDSPDPEAEAKPEVENTAPGQTLPGQTAAPGQTVPGQIAPGQVVPGSTINRFLDPHFFYSGSFVSYKSGSRINVLQSRFVISNGSLSLDFRELFPNLVYLSHTFYTLTTFDTINKSLHIFVSSLTPQQHENDRIREPLQGAPLAGSGEAPESGLSANASFDIPAQNNL